jgi:hypothetical protein
MTLIALEEHLLSADLISEVRPNPTAPDALTAKLVEVSEQRLRVVDDAGIDMQVLSIAAPGTQQVPAEHAAELSRAINDRSKPRSALPTGTRSATETPNTSSGSERAGRPDTD